MSLWGKFAAPNDYKFLNVKSNYLINTVSAYPSFSSLASPQRGTANKGKNSKIRATKRIGAHNSDVISVIFGSLLGDAFAEKHGNGTRICFQQEHSHSNYLIWLYNFFEERGYCTNNIPKLNSRLGNKGKLRYILRFKTYTYSSFNWIQDIFYSKENGKKILPLNIGDYLTPLALAIWISDDGAKVSSGLKLCTNNFTFEEVNLLAIVLRNKYDLKVSIIKTGHDSQYNLYVSKKSMEKLALIIKPYLHPSMYYKLNGYI